jgi:hypothetical protein
VLEALFLALRAGNHADRDVVQTVMVEWHR